jgi:hypothetical protein
MECRGSRRKVQLLQRVIKHEDVTIAVHGSRETDPCPLASTQRHTAFANERHVSLDHSTQNVTVGSISSMYVRARSTPMGPSRVSRLGANSTVRTWSNNSKSRSS